MNEFMDTNRARWDELAAINRDSAMYDVDSFRRGTRDLHPLELAEMGSVDGLDLLHLQCHFGLDTLVLARKGARVTGLDFSTEAIATARRLADEAGIDARFVEGDLYDAPKLIDGRFDMVFVTWGTICWLPDILAWARIVADFLRPGGRFYFADAHPYIQTFDDTDPDGPMRVRFPYFHKPEPLLFEQVSAYADPHARTVNTRTFEWIHGVGEVVTALIDAGLRLDFLHEHAEIVWQAFPYLVQGEDGQYRIPADRPQVPLSYSLQASKPA